MADEASEIGAIDKCLVRLAVIVERNARYLFSQPEVNLFTAVTVLKKWDQGEKMEGRRVGLILEVRPLITLIKTKPNSTQ